MATRSRMKRIEIRRKILPDVKRLAGLAGSDSLTGYVNGVLEDAIKADRLGDKADNRECCKYDERNTGQDCVAYWGPENVPDWCASCLCFYDLIAVPKMVPAAAAADSKPYGPDGWRAGKPLSAGTVEVVTSEGEVTEAVIGEDGWELPDGDGEWAMVPDGRIRSWRPIAAEGAR